jgi:Zn-dependent membrane protease YugP
MFLPELHAKWILLGGILLLNTFRSFCLLNCCYLQQQLFFHITLPVEYDAVIVPLLGVVMNAYATRASIKDALNGAARTYESSIGINCHYFYYVSLYGRQQQKKKNEIIK